MLATTHLHQVTRTWFCRRSYAPAESPAGWPKRPAFAELPTEPLALHPPVFLPDDQGPTFSTSLTMPTKRTDPRRPAKRRRKRRWEHYPRQTSPSGRTARPRAERATGDAERCSSATMTSAPPRSPWRPAECAAAPELNSRSSHVALAATPTEPSPKRLLLVLRVPGRHRGDPSRGQLPVDPGTRHSRARCARPAPGGDTRTRRRHPAMTSWSAGRPSRWPSCGWAARWPSGTHEAVSAWWRPTHASTAASRDSVRHLLEECPAHQGPRSRRWGPLLTTRGGPLRIRHCTVDLPGGDGPIPEGPGLSRRRRRRRRSETLRYSSLAIS